MLPDFPRFPAGSDDYLNAVFTDPRHGMGDIAVDMSQGHRDLCARLLFAKLLETI